MSLIDARGRSLSLERPHRVVSLVPSVTETLCDLGARESLVGITDFCIFPPDLALPRLGGTKNPRVDEIRALAPDLVYVNLEENLERHARQLAAFTTVVATEPKSVDEVVALVELLGSIHEAEARAGHFVSRLQQERERMSRRPFTFACAIWKEPWMWCGGDTYVSRLIGEAGGANVLGNRTRYPSVPLDEIVGLRPELVFLPDEPYAFSDADARLFGGTRVIGPFPGHLFTWHGTRTLLGLRFLRELFEADPAT